MPTELDLEILPFSSYDLIIDARTEAEFVDDHIPGSVNLPALNEEEYAEVGEIARSQSPRVHALGVSAALKRVGDHVARLAGRPAARSALVYCLRGGKRSLVWSGALKAMDIEAKILPGGWKSYRKWVVASLQRLSCYFEYRLIAGKIGSGQEQLLKAIEAEGGQVLDLGAIGNRFGMPLSWLAETEQPSQRLFESLLLDAMRGLSNDSPVWVVNWGNRVGSAKLPEMLVQCLKRSSRVELVAPMPVRVRTIMKIHEGKLNQLPEVAKRMREWTSVQVSASALEEWERLAREPKPAAALERMLEGYFDEQYAAWRVEGPGDEAQVVPINSMSQAAMRRVARMLMADNPKKPMGPRRL